MTTVPWTSFQKIDNLPEDLSEGIVSLKSSAVEVRYCPENMDTEAQWIYYPDEKLPYHRVLVRHNFCQGSKGYWMETRKERVDMFKPDDSAYRYLNEYAYPLNTIQKPQIIEGLLAFMKEKQIFGLGRWGEHNHYNSDVTVERAMNLAEELL